MALLPQNLRYWLFDVLSRQTMRYVDALPPSKSDPLGKRVYDQVIEDFFVNGSLTSRSQIPKLFAGIWSMGRECILVEDRLTKLTKEAMVATLSSINDCPYCGDMLVSLVHAGDRHEEASQILQCTEEGIADNAMRRRLVWLRTMVTTNNKVGMKVPFSKEELPEALGAILAMSDINRFSHVVMDGSPVKVPFGLAALKALALRIFGGELVAVQEHEVKAGRAAQLLPEAELPEDMRWAESNPRIARTVSAYAALVEKESEIVISRALKNRIQDELDQLDDLVMPMSRAWVEKSTVQFSEEDRLLARFALVLAKAPYQLDSTLVEEVVNHFNDQPSFIRFLAWCSFTGARDTVNRLVSRIPSTQKIAA